MRLSKIKKVDDLGRLMNAGTLWFIADRFPYDVKAISMGPGETRYVTIDLNGAIRFEVRNVDMAMIGGVLDVFDDELEAKRFATDVRVKFHRDALAKERAERRKA